MKHRFALRRLICAVTAMLCLTAFTFAHAEASDPNRVFDVDPEKYALEQVLVLSRHNIRSPLSTGGSLLSELTDHEWFSWTSAGSELSLKGGSLETQMGQYFRKYLVDRGLMEENWIPQDGSVRIYANSMQRTIATANYFKSGMFPVANIDVEYHEEIGVMDPVFFPRLTFVSDRYIEAVEQQVKARIDLSELQDNFDLLEEVLDYGDSVFAGTLPHLDATDMTLMYIRNEEPNMGGSLKIANTAADALKLQYYEETDPVKAAFGHELSREDWARICEITEVYGEILFGTPLFAVNVANPLLKEMRSELTNGGRVFTFLCGHDSNAASVLSALRFKPRCLPESLETKTPIGGKIVFEKWRGLEDDQAYVRVSYVYQSLDQLLERSMLDLNNPPITYNLEFDEMEANADGLYPFEDVLNRFETAIADYDRMVEDYK